MSDATDTDTEETQALPGDGLREGIVDALRDDLGEHLLDTHLMPQDDLWVRVSPEAWATAGAALKAQGFDFFCFLSAIDWMPSPYGKGEDNPDDEPTEPDTEIKQGYAGGDSRFQVFARLTDLRRHVGITIKADVPESMTMPTWIGSFSGANWHEREAHEMFGIGFDGHPDLRNLYLPGEFEGFPLRKDFPLLSRMVKPWPGIVDVEPMPEFAEEVGDTPISADGEPLPQKTDDTAAGDAVEEATSADADATEAADAVDESADATVVDTPPTDGDDPAGNDADTAAAGEAVDAADATDDAVEPDGEPATGDVADTIITDDSDDATDATSPTEGDVAPVEADLGEGTVTESTDADEAAPTPGTGIDDPTDDAAAAEEPPTDDEEGTS